MNKRQFARIVKHDADSISLDSGETFRFDRNHRLYSHWQEWLPEDIYSQQPSCIVSDDDLVCGIHSADLRRIDFVGPSKHGRHPVGLYMSPCLYYLNEQHPEYDGLLKLLKVAWHSGLDIMIATEPMRMEIVHAVSHNP